MIVPILNPNQAEELVKLAAALAGAKLEGEDRRIRIIVLGVVTVPEETPLSQGASLVRAYRTMLRYIPQTTELAENLEVQTEVRVAREVWQGIVDQVEEENGDLLLLHWRGSTNTPGKIYGTTIDALLNSPPCDMVLARFNNFSVPIKNILLPVRGGSYNSLSLTLASHLSEAWKANITVLHTLAGAPKTPSNYIANYYDASFDDSLSTIQNLLLEFSAGARLVTLQDEPVAGIVREAAYHDLLIVGASELKEASIVQRIAAGTNRNLLIVKTHKPAENFKSTFGAKPTLPSREASLPEKVDRWFAENTFHYREFRSIDSLINAKERHNLSVSMILPVYGQIYPVMLAEFVRKARYALMRDLPLIDELIICVPNSSLDEAEAATFQEGDNIIYIAPESVGYKESDDPHGPGEALWHTLRSARGDVIVWADAGMSFEARLIYGMIGPLLNYPEFQLATGFYSEDGETNPERSKPVYDNLVELSLRPLIGCFLPQLAGVINPLCSVGAARRDLLEHIPLFTGPAFTTGLLVDTVARSTLMSVAQVDLGSKPPSVLGASSQRITADTLAILLRRVEEHNHSSLLSEYDSAVKTVHKSDGVYSLKVTKSSSPQRELPPIIYTPGYSRQRFKDLT